MRNVWPRGSEAWRNDVERRLSRLRADFATLWRVYPQTPEWPGIPLAGPLDPTPFRWFPEEGTGGTNTGGTNTGGTPAFTSGPQFSGGTANKACEECPAVNRIRVTLSGITNRACTTCSAYNGTHDLSSNANACSWSKGVSVCGTTGTIFVTYAQQSGSRAFVSGVAQGNTYLFVRIPNPAPSAAFVDHRFKGAGCPPAPGQTITLTYDGCAGFSGGNCSSPGCSWSPPATIDITGIN